MIAGEEKMKAELLAQLEKVNAEQAEIMKKLATYK